MEQVIKDIHHNCKVPSCKNILDLFFLRLKDFLMGTKDEISLSGQVSLKDKFFGSEVKPLTAVNGLQEVTRSEGAFTVQWKTHTCTHVAEQRSDFSPNT